MLLERPTRPVLLEGVRLVLEEEEEEEEGKSRRALMEEDQQELLVQTQLLALRWRTHLLRLLALRLLWHAAPVRARRWEQTRTHRSRIPDASWGLPGCSGLPDCWSPP